VSLEIWEPGYETTDRARCCECHCMSACRSIASSEDRTAVRPAAGGSAAVAWHRSDSGAVTKGRSRHRGCGTCSRASCGAPCVSYSKHRMLGICRQRPSSRYNNQGTLALGAGRHMSCRAMLNQAIYAIRKAKSGIMSAALSTCHHRGAKRRIQLQSYDNNQ